MRVHPIWAAIVLVFALSSCVSYGGIRQPRPDPALQGFSVAVIRVETAPDVATFWPSTGNRSNDGQIGEVVAVLKASLARDVVGLPGGPRPARLVVVLRRVDLASKLGGVLLYSDSEIVGSVRLEDVGSGQILAQAQTIRGRDGGHGELGGTGDAATLSLTISLGSRGDLARRLSDDFSARVSRWLAP
jgi:hypothetical protein